MSTITITPSLPVNSVHPDKNYVKSTIMAYNGNYFPNTDITYEGPIFWKKMIEETTNFTKTLDLFVFEFKPYGLYPNQWLEALKNKLKTSDVKVRIVFQPVCPYLGEVGDSCIKNWSDSNCYRDQCKNHTASDYDILRELEKTGKVELVPFWGNSIYGEICSNFDQFYDITKVHGLQNACEGSADLHTKIYIFDKKTFYLGSANLDEAATTEIGVWIKDDVLSTEITKHFDLMFDLSKTFLTDRTTLLDFAKKNIDPNATQATLNMLLYNNMKWDKKYQTTYNQKNPYKVKLKNNTPNSVFSGLDSDCEIYFSLSPPIICPPTWTWDYLAWMDVINSAEKILYITSFDLSPTFMEVHTGDNTQGKDYVCSSGDIGLQDFCSIFVGIENAVYRGVDVRIITGTWPHTANDYLVDWATKVNQKDKAKQTKGSISVITVPYPTYFKNPRPLGNSKRIANWQPSQLYDLKTNNFLIDLFPIHEKYALNEKKFIMSTNNLSGTYFVMSNGASIVINTTGSIRDEMQNYFNMNWYGPYSSMKGDLNLNGKIVKSIIGYDQTKDNLICTSQNSVQNLEPPYDKDTWASKPLLCTKSKSLDCPNNCSGNGQCNRNTGKCVCNPLFSGEDCSKKIPPIRIKCKKDQDCGDNPNKMCNISIGSCICKPGFTGDDCSQTIKNCPNNCSGNGNCNITTGKCICKQGYGGDDCSQKIQPVCPNNCSGFGICINGTCQCFPGRKGDDCSKIDGFECPKDCSGKGTCTKDGKCICNDGYTGDDCSAKAKSEKNKDIWYIGFGVVFLIIFILLLTKLKTKN